MKKIIDLNGTYSSAEIENKWVGRVLLDSNNYFEGFIENYYYNEISYVFGYLDSENFKMIVCSKDNNEMPKKYDCVRFDRTYDGKISVTDLFIDIEIGQCSIKAQNAEITREGSNYELSIIEETTKRQKEIVNSNSEAIIRLFENTKNKSSSCNVKKNNI